MPKTYKNEKKAKAAKSKTSTRQRGGKRSADTMSDDPKGKGKVPITPSRTAGEPRPLHEDLDKHDREVPMEEAEHLAASGWVCAPPLEGAEPGVVRMRLRKPGTVRMAPEPAQEPPTVAATIGGPDNSSAQLLDTTPLPDLPATTNSVVAAALAEARASTSEAIHPLSDEDEEETTRVVPASRPKLPVPDLSPKAPPASDPSSPAVEDTESEVGRDLLGAARTMAGGRTVDEGRYSLVFLLILLAVVSVLWEVFRFMYPPIPTFWQKALHIIQHLWSGDYSGYWFVWTYRVWTGEINFLAYTRWDHLCSFVRNPCTILFLLLAPLRWRRYWRVVPHRLIEGEIPTTNDDCQTGWALLYSKVASVYHSHVQKRLDGHYMDVQWRAGWCYFGLQIPLIGQSLLAPANLHALLAMLSRAPTSADSHRLWEAASRSASKIMPEMGAGVTDGLSTSAGIDTDVWTGSVMAATLIKEASVRRALHFLAPGGRA